MSTPRLGCKYVYEPVMGDVIWGVKLARGAVVTVVPCPGMPHVRVPRKFRYVSHNGAVYMVFSASLVPLRKYQDAGRINCAKHAHSTITGACEI